MILEETVSILVWLMTGCASAEQAGNFNRSAEEMGSGWLQEYPPPDDTRTLWSDHIDREHPQAAERPSLLGYQSLQAEPEVFTTPVTVTSAENEEEASPRTCLRSVAKSFSTSFTIMFVALPLAVIAIFTLYMDLNTTDLCLEAKNEIRSTSFSVKGWQFLGESVQAIPINLWFAATMALLFGWTEFKSNYLASVAIGLAVGAVIIIYKAFSLTFGLFGKGLVYRIPGNILYFSGVICSSVIVARKIHSLHELRPSFRWSKAKIGLIIAMPFVLSSIWCVLYRYCIIPAFNNYEDELKKAILAGISPMISLPGIGMANYIALTASSGMVYAERCFVFVYFIESIPITLYRIMQADFKSLRLFTGLSLLHGGLSVIFHATRSLQIRIWKFIVKSSKSCCLCCAKREHVPFHDTPQYRRLRADLEIQAMLFQYIAVILSQAFFVLSQFEITEISLSEQLLIGNVCIRVAIGVGIEFLFNCIEIWIQIHFHDIPIKRVWSKFWLRHLVANVIIMTVFMCYFAPVMLSVFQVRMDVDHSRIRNCSMPFTH